MPVTVGGRIGAKYLALFDARKSLEDAPDFNDSIVMESARLRPKSSYAGSIAASRINKSRA